MAGEATRTRSAVGAAWRRVRTVAAAAMLGGVVLAVGWMLCGIPVATDRCGFAGLLLAGGLGVGVLAALAAATQLPAAAVEPVPARWGAWPALAEAVVLLLGMVLWPLAGLAVGQVASAMLGSSWQQPFTWWYCCPEHRAASWLALAVLWAWSLTPWAYALVAWQRGARWSRWSAFSAVLLAVPFAVANSWSAVAEPLLRDWRVPGWLLALPWLGMAGGCVVRAAMHGSPGSGAPPSLRRSSVGASSAWRTRPGYRRRACRRPDRSCPTSTA